MVKLGDLRCIPVHSDMFMRIFFVVVGGLASFTSGTHPRRSGQQVVPETHKSNANLWQRDAIVRSTYLKHPSWPLVDLHKEAQSLIAAAGLKPISPNMMRHQLIDIRKDLGVGRPYDPMGLDHAQFLTELYAKDPIQSAGEALATFRAVWGPNAQTDKRVLTWWHNHGRTRRNKRAVSPRSARATSPSSAMPVQDDTIELSDSDLPSNWWNLGEDFDKVFPSDPDIVAGLH